MLAQSRRHHNARLQQRSHCKLPTHHMPPIVLPSPCSPHPVARSSEAPGDAGVCPIAISSAELAPTPFLRRGHVSGLKLIRPPLRARRSCATADLDNFVQTPVSLLKLHPASSATVPAKVAFWSHPFRLDDATRSTKEVARFV